MLFPDTEKVQYERPSLIEVICELRFPEVLKIESETPADFQDRVRFEYPLFEKRSPLALGIPAEVLRELPLELKVEGGPSSYHFSSEDGRWTVALNSGSMSLSTREYRRWSDFKTHLELPFVALRDVYSPAFFSRIGLRYRNVIRPSELDLTNCSWSDLIQPYMAGVLAIEDVRDAIQVSVQQLLIRLPDDSGMVRINHGLLTHKESGEHCYSIDNDFFIETRTEVNDGFEKLNLFKTVAATLFRWCITDRLHHAMRPTPISE